MRGSIYNKTLDGVHYLQAEIVKWLHSPGSDLVGGPTKMSRVDSRWVVNRTATTSG